MLRRSGAHSTPLRSIPIGDFRIGGGEPLVLIAGPCVIESERHAMKLAERLVKIAAKAKVPLIFKASYDKANRSSVRSFRGPGLREGLEILGKVRARFRVPVLTDIHEPAQARLAAEVCDVLQVPGFLSRQTDLLTAAGETGRVVNLKKGQFLSPWEMANAGEKVKSTGNNRVIITERGVSFGYNNLVVDMRSFPILAKTGCPVIFDVTHSVQLPGGQGHASGGQPEFIEPLSRAGTAVGVDGIFLEVHERPERALSDGAEALKELQARLDSGFERAVEVLLACKGRVVVTGMGKSGLIGRKIAATFSSTGTPSVFLHPAEALHGDLGMLQAGDAVVAVSYGGETEEIVALLATMKRLGLPLVTLTGNTRSTLAQASDVVLDTSVREEACSLNLAPTASTTAAMALGDALAIALLERRGFNHDDFAALHPGGRLGKKLLRVRELMHAGEALPSVAPSAKMPDVIYEMSRKGLGMTTVVDAAGTLAGIITDGDLRRLMEKRRGAVLELTAEECMSANPATITSEEFASAALRLMEQRKITSVVVLDGERHVAGVVHVHDLWTLELF